LNESCRNTLISNLGIVFTEVSEDKIVATMPVDSRTMQPMKILHGGAIMALAETIGGAGSYVLIDRSKFYAVGLEINANHVSSATSDFVTGTGKLLHKGKRTHVWEILVKDKVGTLLSICRITNMIIEK
jgi:1,4-dihydroxy-2-naphthoyl-CoA hydrolase